MEAKPKVDHQSISESFIKFFNLLLVFLFCSLALVNFTGPKADTNNWLIFLSASISLAVLTYGLHKRSVLAWALHAALITSVILYDQITGLLDLDLWLDLLIFFSVAWQLATVYNVFKKRI